MAVRTFRLNFDPITASAPIERVYLGEVRTTKAGRKGSDAVMKSKFRISTFSVQTSAVLGSLERGRICGMTKGGSHVRATPSADAPTRSSACLTPKSPQAISRRILINVFSSQIHTHRIKSAKETPAWACFETATIRSTAALG